jgi:transposase
MLTVRFGQLTVEGLSPSKIRSLVGCSLTTWIGVIRSYNYSGLQLRGVRNRQLITRN